MIKCSHTIFKRYKMDRKEIQELLDRGGEIFIPSGVHTVEAPLVIGDNTSLTLAPDAVIRLADGANCEIIRNEGLARKYNKNITVRGGIWDGNNQGQTRHVRDFEDIGKPFDINFYYGIMMRFTGVENFTFRDLTLKDPEAYPVQMSMIKNFHVENIIFDYNMLRTNMDGIHINGPAEKGFIKHLRGATNDDMVALNCDDCYETEITRGPINDVYVEDLYCEGGYTAVRLLSCGDPLTNVTIKNIRGSYRYNAVSFTHHNVHEGECRIDNVEIDGVDVSKVDADNSYALFWFAEGTHTGKVTLRNIRRNEEKPCVSNTVKIDPNTTVESLTMENVTQSGVLPEIFSNSGRVDQLIIKH